MERINALEPVFLDTLPENDALEYGKIYFQAA